MLDKKLWAPEINIWGPSWHLVRMCCATLLLLCIVTGAANFCKLLNFVVCCFEPTQRYLDHSACLKRSNWTVTPGTLCLAQKCLFMVNSFKPISQWPLMCCQLSALPVSMWPHTLMKMPLFCPSMSFSPKTHPLFPAFPVVGLTLSAHCQIKP